MPLAGGVRGRSSRLCARRTGRRGAGWRADSSGRRAAHYTSLWRCLRKGEWCEDYYSSAVGEPFGKKRLSSIRLPALQGRCTRAIRSRLSSVLGGTNARPNVFPIDLGFWCGPRGVRCNSVNQTSLIAPLCCLASVLIGAFLKSNVLGFSCVTDWLPPGPSTRVDPSSPLERLQMPKT